MQHGAAHGQRDWRARQQIRKRNEKLIENQNSALDKQQRKRKNDEMKDFKTMTMTKMKLISKSGNQLYIYTIIAMFVPSTACARSSNLIG